MPSRLPPDAAAEHEGRRPAGPFAGARQTLALGQAARHGQDQRHRHVGGVFGQHIGRVGDGDALGARGGQIDMVDAGAEIGEQLQIGSGLADQRRIDPVGHGRHQHVGGFHRGRQIGGAHRPVVVIEPRVEQLHHSRLDRFGKLARDDHQRLFCRHRTLSAAWRFPRRRTCTNWRCKSSASRRSPLVFRAALHRRAA